MSRASDPVQTRDHGWTQERLSDFVDGVLQPAERDRVEQHLQECGQCSQDLADLKQTVAMLRAMPVRPAPRAFTLRSQPTARPVVRHPLLPLLRFGTGFAGLLLVLMVLMDVWAALGSFGSLALGGLQSAPPAAVAPPAAPEAKAGPTAAPASTAIAEAAPASPAVLPTTAPAEQANAASGTAAMAAQGAGEAPGVSHARPSPNRKALPSAPVREEAAADGQFSFSSPAPVPPAQPGAQADSEGPPEAVPAPALPAASTPEEPGPTLLTMQSLTSTASALSDTARPVTATPSLDAASSAASVPPASPDLQGTPSAGTAAGAAGTQAPPPARPTLSSQERRAGLAAEHTAAWRLVQLVLSAVFLGCLIGWLALDRPVTGRGR